MNYNGIDKWNDNHIEHRNHKYYIKVGDGPNARYFYSAQEYQAWTKGGRQPQKNGPDLAKMGSGLVNKFKKARNGAAAKQMRKQQEADLARARAQKSEDIRAAEERKAKMTAARNKATKNALQRAAGKQDRQVNFLKAKNRIKNRSSKMEAAYKKRNAALTEQQNMKDPSYRRKKKVKQTFNKAKKTAANLFGKAKKTAKTGYQNAAIAYTSPKGTAIRKKVKTTANNAYSTAKRKTKETANNTYSTAKRKTKKTAKSAYNRGRSFVKNLFKK